MVGNGWGRRLSWGGARPAALSVAALALPLSALGAAPLPVSAADPLAAGADCSRVISPAELRAARGGGLPGSVGGTGAVTALADQTDAVATLNSVTVPELVETLTEDATARLDLCGRLFFVDEAAPAGTGTSANAAADAAEQIGPSGALSIEGDAFALNSRPGAPRTIYLDFTGHTLTGTAWNDAAAVPDGFALPAYDINGDPTTFTTAERDAIKTVWLYVAEDYAPFNINVTTQAPPEAAITRNGLSDNTYGTRVVITSDTQMSTQCGCGGIAYVDVISEEVNHAYWQPALVFPQQLNDETKSIAEAASHEAGHNFSLLHDGDATREYYPGRGPWAPIMGVSYNAPIATWSKGEYSGANNLEDDVATIADDAGFAPDDHGDESTTGTEVQHDVPVDGVITSPAEGDFFTFTAAGDGDATVTVQTQSIGPNLNVLLRIFDAEGVLLAQADPPVTTSLLDTAIAAGTGAEATFAATAGSTFSIAIFGVGQGDPYSNGFSAYGSLGRYTVTVQMPLGITTASPLPRATRDRSYATTLAAVGGTAPYTWTVANGVLPPGTTLSTSGTITGVPTTTGTFTFTVAVAGTESGEQSTRALVLDVIEPLRVTTSRYLSARRGIAFLTRLQSSGGYGRILWRVTAGTLPPGLALRSTGVLRGTPTQRGSYSFRAQVRDADGRVASRVLTFTVR